MFLGFIKNGRIIGRQFSGEDDVQTSVESLSTGSRRTQDRTIGKITRRWKYGRIRFGGTFGKSSILTGNRGGNGSVILIILLGLLIRVERGGRGCAGRDGRAIRSGKRSRR